MGGAIRKLIIYQCTNCERLVIDEERATHECKPFKNYKIVGYTPWVSDGEQWYPLKLTHTPLKSKHPEDNTHEGNGTFFIPKLYGLNHMVIQLKAKNIPMELHHYNKDSF